MVRVKEPKAKITQWAELVLYNRILFNPEREINISIGKNDQFQSTIKGFE
jgi:hypothetical protein